MVVWPLSALRMKTTITNSVTEMSSWDNQTENLQSSSDSEDDDELFEDCLSRNTSPAKSDTSADSNPSSDDTYYSSFDIENTAIELDLLSVSGCGTSTGRTIDIKAANHLNAGASYPSHSITAGEVTATRPSQKNLLPTENNIKINTLNLPGDVTEAEEILNVKNANSSNSKAIEMFDIYGHNEEPPSDSSDSGWILVTSSAKAKSRSKTLSMPRASAIPTEIATSCSKSKLPSQIRMKTPSNRKPRGKVTAPKFTIRNPNINTSLRNPSNHIIPTEPFPPSTIIKNPKDGTSARVSYSEALGNSISTKRDVTTDLNETAESPDRPSADALKIRDNDNAITSVSTSLSVNGENKTDDIAQIEKSKSNLKLNLDSNMSSNCATLKPGTSYRFNPAVGTPVRILDMSCNLQDESQDDSLPILEGDDDSFPDHFASDFVTDLVLNLPSPSFIGPNPLLRQDESLIWEQPGTESSNKLSYMNEFLTPDNLQSTEKAGLKKSLNVRAACESSESDNVSPLFQHANDALESQSITYTNISHTSTRNETLESILNKNELPTSPQKENPSIKSQGTNVSLKERTGNISPAKSISKCPFQTTNNENRKEFMALSNDGASSENSSVSNALISCTNGKGKIVHPTCDTFSSQSFHDSPSERPILNNAFPHFSPERPILHSAFPHHTSPIRAVSNRAFSHTSPVRPVLNTAFPPYSPVRPVLNSAVPHTSAHCRTLADYPVSNSAEPHTSAAHPVSNSTVPNTSTNCPASNSTVLHISDNRPVSSIVQPHTSNDRPILNSAIPPNSTGWPVSNIALPYTFPGHPISNYAFSQITNLNFYAFSGPFQMNIQPPTVQNPGIYRFRPPRNFYQLFAQSCNNSTRAPYTRMRQPFPRVPRVFPHPSGYSQPRIFIPHGFPGRPLAPQTNHPPILQQTMHNTPVQHSSTLTPDFNAQRALDPLFNPQAVTGIRTTLRTYDEYPEYVCQDHPSGLGATIYKLITTESGQTSYSFVSEMQFTDSESDPESDDSPFTELSQKDLEHLNRNDFNRYFRRFRRRRNRGAHHDPSAEKTSKLPERTGNQLSTEEPQSYGGNLDDPLSNTTVKKEMNLNPAESGEENDVSAEEKKVRTQSLTEKTYLTHFMDTHLQVGQQSGFRRSSSYPGTSSNKMKL